MRTPGNPARLRLLNCFALCAVPLACWQKWIFPFLPNYHLQHAFVYLAGLFMLRAWQAGVWSLADVKALLRTATPWLAALFALQTAACWHSALQYPVAGQETAITVLIALAKLAAQLPFLMFFALLCSVLTANAASRRRLLTGALAAFCVIAAICMVQACEVYAGKTPPWLSALAAGARGLNITLAPFLEAQWKDGVFDFYHAGSYTATLLRMNGVFEEASTLATWVGCFFLPIALGMSAVSPRWSYVGRIMLALCLAILFASTALTGCVLGMAGMGVAAFHIVRQKRRVVAALCCLALLACVGCAAFFHPAVQARLRQLEVLPRFVVSLASFSVAGKHPLLGVGRGYFSASVTREDRYAAVDNIELRAWRQRGAVPRLSTFPAAMAEYGIPLVLLALGALLSVFKKLRARLRQHPSSALYRFSVPACGSWLVMSCVASLADLEMRNALFLLPLGCFYALAARKEENA